MKSRLAPGLMLLALASWNLRGETGRAAWLRYEPIQDVNTRAIYAHLPRVIVALDSSPVVLTAQREILRGMEGMLGRTPRLEASLPNADCILLATLPTLRRAALGISLPDQMVADAYLLKSVGARSHAVTLIAANNDRGVLFGAFDLLRKLNLHQPLAELDEQHTPYAPVRWTNEWDNLNGTIERGYAGRSIFFDGGNVVPDLTRAAEYARLLASVGINGCTVNNVNADRRILTSDFLPQLARLAAAFRPWGVRMSIAVDFSSPQTVGQLDTFDPIDPRVADWWKAKADELYQAIPDLGGILLKADSEGRVGPSTYKRSHADAANVIARALKPHGGVLIYRGFVYNHHMDWRDLKNDRARAAFDNFAKLDGQFDENVIVQTKYGPIDFQVREPVSPLFGALRHTNETLELQVTQEYTGQQRHLCFLLPMWKQVLDFDLRTDGQRSTLKDVVSGKRFNRPTGGFVAVSNVGLDENWLGHDLAMANLYAFGRIAWDPSLKAQTVVDEWTRLTFGSDERVIETIDNLELESWPVYEQYTGPLGAGGLTDIIGVHYGPGIESSERNGWGQWHRADRNGIGMDRTTASGTGYTSQYPADIANEYETLATTPDNLLLFFHHVPYTYVLHSGKSVIQHIYDSHYEGAERAASYPERWRRLRGHVDEERYAAVLDRLQYQAGHAIVWRDAICNWFSRESGIADQHGRVGSHPGRIEGEALQLQGYKVDSITPWEAASGGKAITCSEAQCSATTRFAGKPGWYDLTVQYFDQSGGDSRLEVQVNRQVVSRWAADRPLPSNKLDSHSSTRRTIGGLALEPGDEIRVMATPDREERAAIDYIEIKPVPID